MTERAVTAVVCDDEPAKRRAVAEILARIGVDLVMQTPSPAELRRIVAAATSPTIIVLDLAIAGMGGLDTVRDLHELCDKCAIVVLSPFTALRADAVAAGARGLVDVHDLRGLECLLGAVVGNQKVTVDPTDDQTGRASVGRATGNVSTKAAS